MDHETELLQSTGHYDYGSPHMPVSLRETGRLHKDDLNNLSDSAIQFLFPLPIGPDWNLRLDIGARYERERTHRPNLRPVRRKSMKPELKTEWQTKPVTVFISFQYF